MISGISVMFFHFLRVFFFVQSLNSMLPVLILEVEAASNVGDRSLSILWVASISF